jgi:glycosyltransferase involved in cell wall biosynthesis
LGILPYWSKRLSLKTIGTAHQPAGWWRLAHPYPHSIAALDALIVPASREVSYFEQYLPGRVFYIPHGIDTEFFRPPQQATESQIPAKSPRCVFSGKHLRDLDTLAEIIDRVLAINPGIGFDMILPRESRDRSNPSLIRIARHEQVCWHAKLSDEQLRELYQKATMLVLPIIDCTANNALLEAIACGLPVISNAVGGLHDYTRDSFADLLPIGDVDGFVNAILRLADDPLEQQQRSKAARSFVEQHLTWTQIARQTIEIYNKVLNY